MYKRIWSFILTICLFLALTPDTVMAATMERTSVSLLETSSPDIPDNQPAPAEQPKTEKKQKTAVSPDLEGSGTTTDPYRIKNAAQLRMFANAVNGVGGAPNTGICATLAQNINLSDVCGADIGSWTPIGTNANPYRGTFDGGSFSVSGLYCHKPGSSYTGLFGVNAGVIKNLGVAGGSVSAGNYAGGLCGVNRGTITGCYNTASVNGDRYTGGICGYNDSGATVSVCFNTSSINGSKYVGGVCGYNKNATSDCYNTGVVTGSGTSIGGICGYNKKLLSGCFNTGEVGGGTNHVGSVCGYNHSGGTLVNCYYLITGTEKGNYGIGMTPQQFASGEVCYALNEGNGGSVVWKQTCGTGLPGFGGKTVYRAQTSKSDGSTVFAYTNDSNKTTAYSAPAPYTAPPADNSGNTSDGHTHVYQEPKWDWKKYESAKATLTCQDCGEEFILKASIKKEVTEPTCTKDGETVYKASVEKDGITFKDKKVVEKERLKHNPEPISTGPASCTEPQYDLQIPECYKCTNCHKYFKDKACKNPVDKKEVEGADKALGHDLNIEWTPWQTGSTPPSISVTITCKRSNCSLNETPKVKVTRIDTIPASCIAEGRMVYKATAIFNGKTFYHDVYGEVPTPTVEHNYNKQGVCSVCGQSKPSNDTSTTKDASDSTLRDETLSDDEAPSLLPDEEETPAPDEAQDGADETDASEVPDGTGGVDMPDTPSEPDGSDGQETPPNTPDNPENSDEADIPPAPDGSDNSDEQDTPNTPDTSGDTDIPNAPGASENSDGADVPNIPPEPGTTDESNAAEPIENNPEMLEYAEPYDLLCPKEAALSGGSVVNLHANAAIKNVTQPAGDQQEMSLWGFAIVLMLLAGIVLLIVLQKKHNE